MLEIVVQQYFQLTIYTNKGFYVHIALLVLHKTGRIHHMKVDKRSKIQDAHPVKSALSKANTDNKAHIVIE